METSDLESEFSYLENELGDLGNETTTNWVFTDREEPRAAFWNAYKACKENILAGKKDIKVLTYYGVGGVGKSTLLQKLQDEMYEKVQQPKYVYHDLERASDCRTVLEAIKNKLADNYNFEFPLFELGLYAYVKKMGENKVKPEEQGFIAKSPLLGIAVETLGMLPVADIGVQLLKLADAGYAFAKKFYEKNSKELSAIEKMLPGKLYEYLPYFFIKDLRNNLENSKEPLVIFLDTYEALVNELSTVGDPLSQDLWLRGKNGLVLHIPNVLWVVAGREKLKWERFNTEKIHWEEALEQHLLGSFSRSDGYFFLENAGITDKDLQHDLYNLTEGSPVYLNLCVDTYYSLIHDGETPKIEAFGKDLDELIYLFIKRMDASSRRIVNMLTCLKFWDETMIQAIAPKIIYGFNEDIYDNVKELSFIRKSNDDSYVMHQIVGDFLFKKCPESMKNAVKEHAVKYCMDKLEEYKVFNPAYHYHLNWLMKFGLRYFEGDKLNEFYNEFVENKLNDLISSAQFDVAETIVAPFLHVANNYSEKSSIQISAMRIRANILSTKGNYEAALELREKIEKFVKESLGEKHPDTIRASYELAYTYLILEKFDKAVPLYERVLELRKETLGESHPDTITALMDLYVCYEAFDHDKSNILIGSLRDLAKEELEEKKLSELEVWFNLGYGYYKLGRRKEAFVAGVLISELFKEELEEKLSESKSFRLREQELDSCKENYGDKHPATIKALSNLAYSNYILGKYDKALHLFEQALELHKEVSGEKHPDTIWALVDLANSYESLGRYEDAFTLKEQALVLSKEVLGEKHPKIIDILSDLIDMYEKLGRYEEALTLREQNLVLSKEIFGEWHRKTLQEFRYLDSRYQKLERYEEALTLKKQVLGLHKKALGEKHADTIDALRGLAFYYERLERHGEALQLFEQVLELSKEVLGEKHPDTIRDLENLADRYESLELYDKELLYREQIYELYKEHYGEKAWGTKRAFDTLLDKYEHLERYDKALQLYEQIYELRKEELGENHPDTILLFKTLIRKCEYLERYDKASQLYEQVLESRKEELGEKHLDTIVAMNHLASYYEHLERYDQALLLREQIYNVCKEKFGEDRPATISALKDIMRVKSR